jgi:hypothetical protein
MAALRFANILSFAQQMPKIIVVRAFSTIDSILNGQWYTFFLIICFAPESLLVHIPKVLFLSPLHFRHFSAF